ncbi:hypothetical protein [Dictyobacter kobayashii]|nr:hypothetical protein [Dictyobacter kobayashii]
MLTAPGISALSLGITAGLALPASAHPAVVVIEKATLSLSTI